MLKKRGTSTRTRGENIFPEILDRQPKAIKKKSTENGSRTVWDFFALHADFCLFDLNRPGQKSFRWPQFWFFSTLYADSVCFVQSALYAAFLPV